MAATTPSIWQSLFGGGTVSTVDSVSTSATITALGAGFTAIISLIKKTLSQLTPDLAGLVDITPLTDALDQTTKVQAMCKNMTTDQCAVEQAHALAATNAAQLAFYNKALLASISNLQSALTTVQDRFNQIQGESAGNPGYKAASIIPQFQSLIASINGDITVLQTSEPYINPPANTDLSAALGSSSGSTRPDYALPSVGTKSGYLNELDTLNTTYDNLMGNPYDLNRLQRIFWSWVYGIFIPIFYYVLLAFCAVWGGVVLSNIYVEEMFVYTRVWYFVHGMIGFPLVLIYTLLPKCAPYWVSTIFPAYPLAAPSIKADPLVEGS